jgi:anti-sigma factor ChrR (cupin superfamily)
MTDEAIDMVGIDEDEVLALAQAAAEGGGEAPGPDVKARLMARIASASAATPSPPAGFTFRLSSDADWQPHPVQGIRMKVLAMNTERGCATLLLDVAPGTRFPAHHHRGAEECYVISGALFTCGRRMGPGDFLHADADSDHGELFTEEGCRVLLVVPPEDCL